MRKPNAVVPAPSMPPAAETLDAVAVILAPLIVSDPGICSGDPTIEGTRIGVHHVVALLDRFGGDVERLYRQEWDYIEREQFDAAIAYYRANKDKIDAILRRRQADSERLWAHSSVLR